jgi:N-acetyl-anhydromuramyl-L-alanine amidase AmpD
MRPSIILIFAALSRRIRLLAVGLLLVAPSILPVAAHALGSQRAGQFQAAAQELGVPVNVLLAVSYNESRWTPHGSAPSVDNGFGLMDLRTKTVAQPLDGRGDPAHPAPATGAVTATHYTLDDAAVQLHISTSVLKTDDAANIRGGAAVLAKYARDENNGQLPPSLDGWYAAVVDFSGANDATGAQSFADDVYATLQTGASLTTTDGQSISLPATPNLSPNKAILQKLGGAGTQAGPKALSRTAPLASPNSATSGGAPVDCPSTLNCRFIPAAYAPDDPNDPANYGNYDPANRPQDMKIKYIVIHDTEGSYGSAINHFQDPLSYVSGNYIIRSSDGAITEMVRPSDVSWGAGNWYVNMHAINIEHEGVATQGGTWYTEAMYQSSATLVQWLAAKYHIPLDRQHILGHDNIPALSGARMASRHWDPGPYWDWNHYMSLLHAPITSGPAVTSNTKVLTISPDFATNQQTITDCSSGTCVTLPAQGSNLVYLHTAPNASSPLLTDKYKHPDSAPGTTEAGDWSATANAGDQYVLAGKQGDWTAIWYGGQRGWFYNPAGSAQAAHVSSSRVITPKPGLASIPVYGGAYPEASAYPSDVPFQGQNVLYTIYSGQYYTTAGKAPATDYFYDATINYSLPDDHVIVHGTDVFYQITFNHRQAYVKASDVSVKTE